LGHAAHELLDANARVGSEVDASVGNLNAENENDNGNIFRCAMIHIAFFAAHL